MHMRAVSHVFGGETSNRVVAGHLNRTAVDALLDGYSSSVISFGNASETTLFGSTTNPGSVYYAIEQIHARTKAVGGQAMWQVCQQDCAPLA